MNTREKTGLIIIIISAATLAALPGILPLCVFVFGVIIFMIE